MTVLQYRNAKIALEVKAQVSDAYGKSSMMVRQWFCKI